MLYLIIGILVLASAFMVILILAQNPKGGGLSGTFGGAAQQFLGARQGADMVEKLTWYCSGAIFVCVFAIYFVTSGGPSATDATPKISEGIGYDVGTKKAPAKVQPANGNQVMPTQAQPASPQPVQPVEPVQPDANKQK